MDKIKLAHEYMQNTLKLLREHNISYDFKSLVEESFDYADAMRAEADKRKPSGLPDALKEEWQPDWSQAPGWANWWAMDEDSKCHWFSEEPDFDEGVGEWILKNGGEGLNNIYSPSLCYYYASNWKDSLRERPE